MYFTKTPKALKNLFPNLIWEMPAADKKIYLTFDDGPVPGVTDWVLDQLDLFGVDATFFCIGKNVEENPDLYQRLVESRHSIGNHSYSHMNGWVNKNISYYKDILKAKQLIDSKMYRPPYGRISMRQARVLLQNDFKVVMWDVVSGDFNQKITKDQCLQNVIQHSIPGSIILLHDSLKAKEKMQYVLPKFIEYCMGKGFEFGVIS